MSALRRFATSYQWKSLSASTLRHLSLSSSIARNKIPSYAQIPHKPAVRCLSHSFRPRQSAQTAAQEGHHDSEGHSQPASDMPIAFSDLAERQLLSMPLFRGVERELGLKTMTDIQSLTFDEALKGTDVLAQAKTGTGKTIGFLLPALQRMVNSDPSLLEKPKRYPGMRGTTIRGLIISPTRELAEQIATEAKKLVAHTGIIVQRAVGGNSRSRDLVDMHRQGCHLLVGTPGRLQDILSDPGSGVKATDVEALVLDEADRLMDDGFLPAIREIMELLPPSSHQSRQTLMFSATIPKQIVRLAREMLKPNHSFVRTVSTEDRPTHERVAQNLVTVRSLANLAPALFELCKREHAAAVLDHSRKPFKAIVYFNTAADARLHAMMFQNLQRSSSSTDPAQLLDRRVRVMEMHARLSQQTRTRTSEAFRGAKSAILMSSDVTARGMDFPDVTHIIQVGVPRDRDQYVHRLGRTARAGKEGEGWLLIPGYMTASDMFRDLSGLGLEPNDSLSAPDLDYQTMAQSDEPWNLPNPDAKPLFDLVTRAASYIPEDEKVKAFMASLGVLSGFARHRDRIATDLNRTATLTWGMREPPAVNPALLAKLGFHGTDLVAGAMSRPMRDRSSQSLDRHDFRSRSWEDRRPRSMDRDGGSWGGRGFGEFDRPARASSYGEGNPHEWRNRVGRGEAPLDRQGKVLPRRAAERRPY